MQPATRNTRLAAIRTFYRYCLLRHPEHAATIERVLQIGPKRHERALVTYLTEPELDTLIDAPDARAGLVAATTRSSSSSPRPDCGLQS
jgi:site-specific recombinase XerD